MASTLPPLGTRIRLAGYIGTVRFVGNVVGSQGTWLGVEWDDHKRGKHDGVKDGIRYFSCSVAGAGSFIRPTASVVYGESFLAALKSKYVESLQGTHETVILGSSNGAIEVDAANLDLIRRNLALLDRLRAVSLQDICTADIPGEIAKSCPNITSLDLSFSLISSWDTVTSICVELPRLETLELNHTRLTPLIDSDRASKAFLRLQELSLNGTNMSWPSIILMIGYMPQLSSLEAGLNNLKTLESGSFDVPSLATTKSLHTINLDSNELGDWIDICRGLQPFFGLERLILTSNGLITVPALNQIHEQYRLQTIKNIAVSSNGIRTWEDVDNLGAWLPSLTIARLMDNPIYSDDVLGKYYWQLSVARLPSLEELDGTRITSKERRDCELFYINWIAREGPESEEAKRREHPRWVELCDKWGRPDQAPPVQASQNKLSSQLIQLNVYRLTAPPVVGDKSAPTAVSPQPTALKVLRTMTLRTFRAKVLKTFKAPRGARARFWLRMADSSLAEVDFSHDDTGDLSWWGLDDDAQVFLFLES